MSLFCTGYGAESRRVVRVGYGELSGYYEQTENGRRSGYGYDYLQELGMCAGWDYEYIGYDKSWGELLGMLERGEIDLLSCVNKTPEREKKFVFSEKPVGLSFACITVKAGETRFVQQDYSTWDGMRMGMVSENRIDEQFAEWAKEKNIRYIPVFFRTDRECHSALMNGTIDSMLSINFRRMENEWMLERLFPESVYFMMNKGNAALQAELNRALIQLEYDKPTLHSELVQKYYQRGFISFLQKRERSFIEEAQQNGKVFRALLDPDRFPLVFLENGTFKGLQYDIIQRIIKHSKLNIQLIPCQNHAEYVRLRQSGDFDILLDARDSFFDAETEGLYCTDEYLVTPVSLLSLKERMPCTGKTALQTDHNLMDILRDSGIDVKTMVYFSSLDDVVRAIKDGTVDNAYLNTWTCNEILRLEASGRLASVVCPGIHANFSMAIKRSLPQELLFILNHAISAIPESEIDVTMISDEYNPVRDFRIMDWIEAHPLKSVVSLLSVLAMVIAIFIYILFARRVSYRTAKVLERLPLRFLVINRSGKILLANAPDIVDSRNWNTLDSIKFTAIAQIIKESVAEAFQKGISRVDYDHRDTKRSAVATRLAKSIFGDDAVIWVSQDTNELQDAKANALDLATRMRLKLKSIGDAVMDTDVEGRITLMNPMAERFCGITEEAALGKKYEECFNIVSYGTSIPVPSPIRQVLATGETIELANHTDLISLDGTRRHIAVSASAVRGADGKISGGILVFRDVTEEYNKRDRINELNESFRISTVMAKVIVFRYNPDTMSISGVTALDEFIPVENGKLDSFEKWVFADDVAKFKQYVENVRHGEHEISSIIFRSGHSGSIRTFRCFLRKASNFRGELIGVMQEVTEYVEQEKLLRQTEQMWELIGNSLPIHLFAKNVDDGFRYVMANRKFASFVGKTTDELIGKTDQELFKRARDSEWFEKCDSAIVESGESRQFTEAATNAGGQELQLQTLKTICVSPGGMRLLVGISMDITETVNKEKELQKTRDMWRLIADTLPVYLFALNVDDHFRYVMVNHSFADFVGIPQAKLIGKTCRDVYPREEDWRSFEEHDLAIVEGGKTCDVDETTVDKNGNPVRLRTILSPVPGANGERLLIGVSVDVTAEKERENKLRICNEKLQRYSELDQFQKQCMAELMVEPNFDLACEKIVNMLGKCMKSSYVVLQRYHQDDRPSLISERGWQKNGNEELLSIQSCVYEDEYPLTFARLKNGLGYCLERTTIENTPVAELEDWQREFFHFFQKISCVELTCVPITHRGNFWGVIVTDHYQAEPSFGEYGQSILNSAVDMVNLLLVKEDISRELRRSENEKILLLDILPLPVVVLSADARIVHYNKVFATLSSSSDADLTGESCAHILCGKESCEEIEYPLRLTLLCHSPQQIERTIGKRNYLLKTMPINDSTGINRVIVIYIDLTEMTQRQELLRQAMEKAKEAEKAKSYFLATMSHEIRTPLNAVIGFSELLLDSTLSEEQRKDFTSDISVAGNALLLLINDVLDLSKLESGQMSFSKGETDFSKLMEMLETVFRGKLKEKGLQLVIEIKPMPHLMIDEQRLRQILFNLLGNAVKFTASGAITVRGEFRQSTDSEGTLIFSVADTGCGIYPEDQKRIFEPFVQAPEHHGVRNVGGTGLGLSIICRLLERMNGNVTLKSTPGQGSTFTVEIRDIPFIVRDSSNEPIHITGDGETLKDYNLDILVVDDAAMNLKFMTALCRKLCIQRVETANDGKTALAKLKEHPFDMVLTDMWMSEMNGDELAISIRKLDTHHLIKIIALTADVDTAGSFDMSVFDAVLTKPISSKQLKECIQKLCV